MLDGHRVIVYDCEVFHSDWLFVFKEDGRYTSIWNDPAELAGFVEINSEALFVGYNSSHYDLYILKAATSGRTPEEVKEVNDWIVGTDNLPWEHPYLEGVYLRFNDVDLMKDTQQGTSLKSIEAHAGMSVEESEVPFDIDRALTGAERAEVEHYCRHDVDATEKLLHMREGYLLTKARLGERAAIPAEKAMALTNAKLTAAVLHAEPGEWKDEREYRCPENLLLEWVPEEALAFFDRVRDASVPDGELWSGKLDMEVGGCPVTLGFGGIHGALPCWRGESGGGRQLVNADVSSYYPSLMVRNGYTSRAMPSPGVFEAIYEERLAAKAAGDKDTANALKLIVNTTYGATLNQYNDLYDPLMARSVCISGQLYLLELACHLVAEVEGLQLVQLNTDGILASVPDAGRRAFDAIAGEWQKRTGFALEFDAVERIWQKDVNNYALRKAGGAEKVKGGYLVRGVAPAGAFAINNNATVVADALRRYLLDGVPVEETVRECADPWAFQLVAKAGRKYSEVWREVAGGAVRVPAQRCNRVFAAKDQTLGRLYKVKAADGAEARVEGLPDHCLVCNAGLPDMAEIDVEWYAALARRRAQDFLGEAMTEEQKEEAKATRRAPAKKQAAPDYSKMNVYGKLALARRMFLDAQVKKTGKNRHLEFEYFQLSDITPAQTRIFAEVGLLEHFTYVPGRGRYVERADEEGTALLEREDALAVSVVYNVDDPEECLEFRIRWTDLPVQLNRDGKEISNPVQDMGKVQTYLRRYLKMQVLDLSEPDMIDELSQGGEGKEKAASASKPAKPATASENRAAAQKASAPGGAASGLQVAQLKKQLKKVKDAHGAAHPEVGAFIAELGAATNNLADVTKEQCEQAIRRLGELKESIEGAEGGNEA